MASQKVARHGVRYALLGLLVQNGRVYGYGLAMRVSGLLGDAAAISPGLVYTSLDSLEKEGLIKNVGEKKGTGRRNPRILYEATEKGIEVLAEWFASHYTEPVRWDLAAKLALLKPHEVDEMLRRIDDAEDECAELVEDHAERVAQVAGHPWHGPFVRHAHKFGVGQVQSRLDWLQEARRLVLSQQEALTTGRLGPVRFEPGD